MRFRFLCAAAVCALAALPSSAGSIEPARYEGRVAVKQDAQERIVVTLDLNGNGEADRLFLFDPVERLPRGIAAAEFDAIVESDPDALRVLAKDGSRNLRLLVNRGSDALPAVVERGALLVVKGNALAEHDRTGLAEGLWSARADDVGLVASNGIDCGHSDLDCSSGGIGSTSCDIQCGGGGASTPVLGISLAARRCSVSCGAGYYSCCYCDAGGETCRCRSVEALRPCDGPIAPVNPK